MEAPARSTLLINKKNKTMRATLLLLIMTFLREGAQFNGISN